MKNILIATILLLTITSCNQHNNDAANKTSTFTVKQVATSLDWMSIDEFDKLDMTGKKGVLVDVYTDWCGYCKIMDKYTFTDPEVIAYLADNYYLIKFNAEQKEPIQFDGRTFEWKAGGRKGYNTLASYMLEGQMSYPSMVYYNEDKLKIIAVPGYKKPTQLLNDIERVQKLPM
ncbi:MAG: thioredoxin fold domain-containing protein [Saprospiraceae bacterium]|jgi:thiol:disulfide interchange protein|nr:thioredoxin fold domain-containing protein [Saprospiraceae bacterium]